MQRCLFVRRTWKPAHSAASGRGAGAFVASALSGSIIFPHGSTTTTTRILARVGARNSSGGTMIGGRADNRGDEHGDFGIGPLCMDRSMVQHRTRDESFHRPRAHVVSEPRRDGGGGGGSSVDDPGPGLGSTADASPGADCGVVRHQRPIYVAATRQHVGKTSVSLALVSHFAKRFGTENVGYMKAVGQQCLRVWEEDNGDEFDDGGESDGNSSKKRGGGGRYVTIDKDVKLVRDHFRLHHLPYSAMSPILIPQGYTKDYLDGRIDPEAQMADIRRAYLTIVSRTAAARCGARGAGRRSETSVTVCEGTGHAGVGSVVGAGNARVAAELGADVVLVANGGLGRAFDELELNRALCTQYGVNIAGVVINKVRPDKYDQTREYLTKAIQSSWTGPDGEPAPPLLGVVPDRPYLGCPALADVETTFGSVLLSGSDHRYRHYDVGGAGVGRTVGLSVVTTDLAAFLRTMKRQGDDARTLFVCHATRDDVILGFLGEYRRRVRRGLSFQLGLVVCTGSDDGSIDIPPEGESGGGLSGIEQLRGISPEVCEMIADAGPSGPAVLVAAGCSPAEAAERIRTMTPKFNADDERRVSRAVEHYEPYIDFDLLLRKTSSTHEVGEGGGSRMSDRGQEITSVSI